MEIPFAVHGDYRDVRDRAVLGHWNVGLRCPAPGATWRNVAGLRVGGDHESKSLYLLHPRLAHYDPGDSAAPNQL